MQLHTWIYSLASELNKDSKESLQKAFDSFLSQWKSHGVPVSGLIKIMYERFVIIQTDSLVDRPSGCSIDSLKRAVANILHQHQASFLDAGYIFYRNNEGSISYAHYQKIPSLIEEGVLDENSIVFDHSLSHSDDLTKWEILLKDSWMKRYLPTKLNS